MILTSLTIMNKQINILLIAGIGIIIAGGIIIQSRLKLP